MFELLRAWIFPLSPRALGEEPTLQPHQARRKTTKYKKKQSIVKSVWITMGLIMLTNPVPSFVAAVSLFTTFLSFIILDETP